MKTIAEPYTKTQRLAYDLIVAYVPKTSHDIERLATAIQRYNIDIERYENGDNTDSALHGKIDEILNRSSYSKRYDVADMSADDSYIYIDGKRKPLENKTNTTCIEEYYFKPIDWQKTHYIHYTINDYTKEVVNKKTGHVTPSKHLYFNGILSFYDLFTIAHKFNAVRTITANPKLHNGNRVPLMYLRHGTKLCKYLNSLDIVPFDRNARNYISEDFIIEYE